MALPFEQAERKDKPRDDFEANTLKASREASQALENQIGNEENFNKLPTEKERIVAKKVLKDIKTLINKTDSQSLATLNELVRGNENILNSIDPSLLPKLFQALREMGKERYREAARSGNVPVLTAGAMDYISQATNIYEQVARDLQVREKQEAQEGSPDTQLAQYSARVETMKQKLKALYKNLGKLEKFDPNNVA